MNKDKLLKEILDNVDLKEKYWPELKETESINQMTLLKKSDELNNEYLKFLYTLITNTDSSTKAFNQSISNLF